jgi:demethylmenaquinone methyltransferase/2-methoxy-6-polyprenyl-1,4-benzoquinol methylase
VSRDAPARSAPPEVQVERMFDRIVRKYDLMNTLLSLGLDRWWRSRTARVLRVSAGDRVLDLGCGTGKLGMLFVPRRATVVGVDVSEEMLHDARRQHGAALELARGSAFRLPFADAAFRGATSGFVLRNLVDLPAAFAELARVIEPGGTLALVDITGPQDPLLRKGFDLYFRTVAPLLGALVGQRDPYRYLSRSLEQLPGPEGVRELLQEAGFARAEARALSLGMVTLWIAERP